MNYGTTVRGHADADSILRDQMQLEADAREALPYVSLIFAASYF